MTDHASSPYPHAPDPDSRRLPDDAALRQSEAFNRSLIESSRDCLKLLTLDGRLLWMNDAGRRLLCIRDLNHVLGKSWIDFWAAEEDREAAKQAIAAAAAGGSGSFTAMYCVCGQERWFDVLLSPVRGADGPPEKLLAASRDITERRQFEHSLRQTEERFQIVSRATNDAVWDWNLQDNSVWWNQGVTTLFGYPPEQVAPDASWWFERLHPQDRSRVSSSIHQAIARTDALWREEYRFRRADNTYADVLDRGYLLRNPQGRALRMIGAMQDITAQKRSAAALSRSQELLALVSNTVPALISFVDTHCRYQFCNRAYSDWFGLPSEQIIGQEMRSVLGESAWAALEPRLLAALAGQPQVFETEAPYAHGGTRWIRATYTPHLNAQGAVDGLVVMVLDITAAQKAEAALRQSEKRFRSFVEATAQIVWRTNPQGEVDHSLPSWNAFTGQTDAQTAGLGWMNAIHPDDRPAVVAAWQRASASQSTYQVEYRLQLASGEWHFVLARGVPVFADDGSLREYIGTCMDVTEQRNAEAALRQSREDLAQELRMTSALHKLAVEFLTWQDLNSGLHAILQTALTITGTERGTIQFFDPSTRTLQLRASRGFSDEWLRFYQTVHGEGAACGEAMRQGQRIIVQDVRASHVFAGTPALQVQLREGVLAVQSTPLIGRGGQFLGMLSTHFREPHAPSPRQLHWLDLLARQAGDLLEFAQAQRHLQRNESDLREREAVLRTVTSKARVGLVMIDQQRRYLFANQTFADILGLPSADIVGKRVPEVLPHVYDQIQPNLDRGLAGERVTYELHLRQHPTSGEERFYEVIYEPRIQDTPNPYVILVLIDITERKRTEQRLENLVAERTAALRDTVAELEAFSYTIVHDMRAPLRAMQSFSAMLIDEYSHQLTDEPRELLGRIVASASRLDYLIRDVLNYSKVVRAEFPTEPVDTQALLEEILDTYPNLRPEVADVTLTNHLPRVLGNRAALTQVFSNLLGNAVKFVAPGTRPRVTIRSEPVPPSGSNSPTHYTRLCFEDNGTGIEPQQIPKLFHMFYRAHRADQYEGTGMGLAIVRKAVERMGGRAGVESQLGHGSRFWVELPLAPWLPPRPGPARRSAS